MATLMATLYPFFRIFIIKIAQLSKFCAIFVP